jgi:nucleotide-binding universal stress UspA family protein
MLTINTILCPIDFSKPSENSLPYAKELARNSGATLILLNVVGENFTDAYGVETISLEQPERNKKDAEAKLKGIADRIAQEIPDVKIECIVMQGNATEIIVNTATDTKADLIIMGSHGRTGLGRLLMGSVAEWVFRNAPCPVLLVKPTHNTLA